MRQCRARNRKERLQKSLKTQRGAEGFAENAEKSSSPAKNAKKTCEGRKEMPHSNARVEGARFRCQPRIQA
jgi:hypothetical protein